MNKLTSNQIINFIEKNKIPFSSTHQTLSVPIINRIYQKMLIGVLFDEIKIFENLVVDGHHRYIGLLLSGKNPHFIKSSKTSATQIYDWKNVQFVDEEWDTPEKIYRLNEIDANYNNIDLKILIEITN